MSDKDYTTGPYDDVESHPTVTSEEGLARTIEWYAEHGDWWRPKKAQIEAAYAAKGQ